MHEIYFYHSFPRHHHYDADNSIAFKTLASILKNGLLLTAEPFPQPHGLPQVMYAQKRTCFTAAHPSAIRKHGDAFGRFSMEFDGDVIRAFGAQPAFYLTAPRQGVELLNDAGAQTAMLIAETHAVLTRLWALIDNPPDAELGAAAKKVLETAWPEERIYTHSFQHLVFAVETLLNLYYRTDNEYGAALRFFEQREWKIVPNFSADQKTWHYRDLTPEEKAELRGINPDFFNAIVCDKPRVEQCSYFNRIGTRHIVEEARRLIVPDEFVEKVERMVKDAKLTREIPVEPISALPHCIPGDASSSGTPVGPCH